MFQRIFCAFIFQCALWISAAQAQELPPPDATEPKSVHYVRIASGTGFIVNKSGDVITNAHVVKNCRSIIVRVPKGEVSAKLLAVDAARDLAALRIHGTDIEATAPLRANISELKLGDEVTVMGYPGSDGLGYRHTLQKTVITSMVGPDGEESRILLKHVAEHGNSGGPVLDGYGNVIGVIMAIVERYHTDTSSGTARGKPTLTDRSDIVITLAELRDFLHAHRISAYESASNPGRYEDPQLEETASQFIVPVRCILGAAR